MRSVKSNCVGVSPRLDGRDRTGKEPIGPGARRRSREEGGQFLHASAAKRDGTDYRRIARLLRSSWILVHGRRKRGEGGLIEEMYIREGDWEHKKEEQKTLPLLYMPSAREKWSSSVSCKVNKSLTNIHLRTRTIVGRAGQGGGNDINSYYDALKRSEESKGYVPLCPWQGLMKAKKTTLKYNKEGTTEGRRKRCRKRKILKGAKNATWEHKIGTRRKVNKELWGGNFLGGKNQTVDKAITLEADGRQERKCMERGSPNYSLHFKNRMLFQREKKRREIRHSLTRC